MTELRTVLREVKVKAEINNYELILGWRFDAGARGEGGFGDQSEKRKPQVLALDSGLNRLNPEDLLTSWKDFARKASTCTESSTWMSVKVSVVQSKIPPQWNALQLGSVLLHQPKP